MNAWATAVGVVLGAAISVFGNWLNNPSCCGQSSDRGALFLWSPDHF